MSINYSTRMGGYSIKTIIIRKNLNKIETKLKKGFQLYWILYKQYTEYLYCRARFERGAGTRNPP